MSPIDAASSQRAIRVLIVFDSWEGHTAAIAKHIADGAAPEPHTVAYLCSAAEATRERLREADALVMGSPVHQRTMSWPMKRFVDLVCEPAWFYDEIVGRVGAVFTTGGGHGDVGGGCELAQLSMLGNLAACGLTLVTYPKTTPGFNQHGMHWGPHFRITGEDMQPKQPDQVAKEGRDAAFAHGQNIARVTARLRRISMATGNNWPPEDMVRQRQQMEQKDPTMGRPQH
jgi:NAD(P)H dehydrogenase (quinone)